MTALLQAATGSEVPILLRYDTVLGHSWGASADRELDYRTDVLSFIFSQIAGAQAKERASNRHRRSPASPCVAGGRRVDIPKRAARFARWVSAGVRQDEAPT